MAAVNDTSCITIEIIGRTDDGSAGFSTEFLNPNGGDDGSSEYLQRAVEYATSVVGGIHSGTVRVHVSRLQSPNKLAVDGTIDQTALVANDTFTFGGTVLTWKAAAASNSEITIGADDAACRANLYAVLEANPATKGIFVGYNLDADAADKVRVEYRGPVSTSNLVTVASSRAAALTWSAANFAPASAVVNRGITEYRCGGAFDKVQ